MITSEYLNKMQKKYHPVINKKYNSIMPSFIKKLKIIKETINDDSTYSQGKTGYCWLVSTLYCISKHVKKHSGMVVNFSKSYLIFCDKLEKANKFFDQLIYHLCLPIEHIENIYILNNAMTDKGQWTMAKNLIIKYGIVPNECCPDKSDKISTTEINACLNYLLRLYAKKMRDIYIANNSSLELVYELKNYAMQVVYNLLVDYYGFHINDIFVYNNYKIKPQEYFIKYIDFPFDNYISIFADDSNITYQYEIDLDGNISYCEKNTFLNVPNNLFSDLVEKQVNNHSFCWCSGDAGKFYIKNKKLFDDSVFDLTPLICDKVNLNRVNILKNHIAVFSHAMVITEKKQLSKEYFVVYDTAYSFNHGKLCFMSRSWFEKFMFQAVISKELFPKGYLENIKLKKVKPWEFFHMEI